MHGIPTRRPRRLLPWIVAAWLLAGIPLLPGAAGVQAAEPPGQGPNAGDATGGIDGSHGTEPTLQLAFLNRPGLSAMQLGSLDSGWPKQCPHRTLKRRVKLPLLGALDVRAFCVPRGRGADPESSVPHGRSGEPL